jgi:hypothetical protein
VSNAEQKTESFSLYAKRFKRMLSRKQILAFTMIILSLFYISITAASGGYDIQFDDTTPLPEQSFTYQGSEYQISETGHTQPGSSMTVTTSAPTGEDYVVYLVGKDGPLQAKGAVGSDTTTFDLSGLKPGTYAIATVPSSEPTAVLPVVIEGYDVATTEVTSGEQISVTASVTQTAQNADSIDRVKVKLWNSESTIEVTATEQSNGEYRATIPAENFEPGVYSVITQVEGSDQVYGEVDEVLGLSSQTTLTIRSPTPTPTPTPTLTTTPTFTSTATATPPTTITPTQNQNDPTESPPSETTSPDSPVTEPTPQSTATVKQPTPTMSPQVNKTATPSTVMTPTNTATAESSFQIESISLGEENLTEGKAVRVSVTVRNQGSATQEMTLPLRVNGEQRSEKRITVAPGSSKTALFEQQFTKAGNYSITIGSQKVGQIQIFENTKTATKTNTNTPLNETPTITSQSSATSTLSTPPGGTGSGFTLGQMLIAIATILLGVRQFLTVQ